MPNQIAALRARVLALAASGDGLMAERLSRLIEPGPHAASILITDFRLAQPLPSPVYFSLVKAVIAVIDDVIVRAAGVTAGHAATAGLDRRLRELASGGAAGARP